MAYVKTVWEDNKTPLDAANLNKIEEGIENAMSLAETNEKDIGTLDGQVAAIEVGKQDKIHAGEGIEITTNNAVNVKETELTSYHMPVGVSAKADGIYATKQLWAEDWSTYLSQTFNDVTPIVAGDGIVFNKHGDKDQMESEYFDVAVNKDAVPYFPTLDKNKYSLLSWDKAKQDWLTVDFSAEPSSLSVARRTSTGQIKCEAPIAAKEAANKAYVDSADAALNTQCTNLAKYLPTFTSWISGADIQSKTFDVDGVRYSDSVPKCLVLDLNLNRTGASAGTCTIKAELDAIDSEDPSKKTSQELFNESAEGESGASLVGKIILEHDDEDAYFQWKYIHICYDYYVAGQFVKHVDKVKENTSAYYGAQQLVLYVTGQGKLKSNLTKQYANKE